MTEPTYNAWRLISLSPLPPSGLWLLGLLLAGAVLWTARSLLRERRLGRRAILIGLRAASAALLMALVLEPGLQRLQTTQVKSRFVILVDRSRSMGFPADNQRKPGEAAAPDRAQAVARWATAQREALQALAQRFQLEILGFAGETEPSDLAGLMTPSAKTGSRTDLLGALKTAAQGNRALAGMLVLSDGADNAQLASSFGAPEQAQLQALGAPVNTLVVGRTDLKDLAVASLHVDDFAFVRNPLTVEVALRGQGFGGERVPVTLARGGRVVASATATLDRDGDAKVKLVFTPDETGDFVYTASVPVFPGEATAANNQRAFVLKVIRDRMRVLLVCGHPSWDERFLRGLLHQDPNVDLVSFFILRDTSDHSGNSNDLSLIPFPVEEIFRDQLHSFDLVILQNFANRPLSFSVDISRYFPDLKRYVQEGGALLMIGGENSFGEGKYDQTELAEVLPVTGVGLAPPTDFFHVQLTEDGKRHPVTQLAESGELSARMWAALPAVPGLNVVQAKPEARVLLSHPLLSTGKGAGAGSDAAPVLVVADEGRGRSMALMTDSSWRWSFEAAGAGLGNRAYERFFTNALRWLVRDPELTQVRLQAPEHGVEPGLPVAFDVKVREADYGPAAGADVVLTVEDADTGKEVARQRATATRDGTARVELPGLPAGAYRIIAETAKGGVSLGRGEQAIAVHESGPETEDPLPHPDLLARIAKLTGGVSGELGDGFPRLKTVHESEEVEIGRRKEVPLWDGWLPLAGIAVLLGLEWLLRRRWGFA